MTRRIVHRAVVVVLSVAITVLFIELVTRRFVKPSDTAFGTLGGLELPPVRIVGGSGVRRLLDPSSNVDEMRVDGKRLARDDLRGHTRLDPVLGYSYQENVTSSNGWWQSNNLGARAREKVERAVPAGRTRILVFGESFAHGSRLPQEQAWPSILHERHEEWEVLNFAVDGYSMAQSLLRYREIRRQLEYNVALLMFVPEADLWRDINTLRQLDDPQWDMPLMPRFILQEGELQLARPLYPDPFDLYRKNSDQLSPELREHLRGYDRLYSPRKYEEPFLVGKLILYKLLARASWIEENRELRASLMNPGREAQQVSRAIFGAMQREVASDGAAFALAILPMEPRWWSGPPQQVDVESWQRMVSFVCAKQMHCIDLLPELLKVMPQDVDRAYDDWHFGPKMNSRIANVVQDALRTWHTQTLR